MIIRHRHTWSHGCDCCCCNLDPLLFDLFPGAAAGYSVRRLSLTYEGAAMQVRRSSDNTTLDIGFDGEDLDIAALLTFAGVGSAFVSIWYDQSGFGRNAIQATTANQPRIVNGGVLTTEFTKSAIRFGLANTVRMFVPSASLTVPQPQTTVAVAKLAAISGINQSILYDSYDPLMHFLYNTGSSDPTNNRWDMSAGVQLQATSPTTSDQALFFSLNNGLNSTLHINSTSILSGSAGTNSLTGLSIGHIRGNPTPIAATYDWGGTIQEIIIYDSNQSANRIAIEGNINAYYNIY